MNWRGSRCLETSRRRSTISCAIRRAPRAPRSTDSRIAVVSLSRLPRTPPGQTSSGRRGRSRGLDVVYEDDAIVVVNKPPGLLSVPLERNPAAPSVFDQLVADIDRTASSARSSCIGSIQDSSGLVVFARSPAMQRPLVDQFRRREPERVYLAVVHGRPQPPTGTWRDRLVWNAKALIQRVARPGDSDAEEAISEYRVVEDLRNASLLEVRLRTGRRNQIRIQAAIRGMRSSVSGDIFPRSTGRRHPLRTSGAARASPDLPSSPRRPDGHAGSTAPAGFCRSARAPARAGPT